MMKKHDRRESKRGGAPVPPMRMSPSFGLHIFLGPFSRRKMKLLLYQFLPRISVRSGRWKFHVSSHLSFRFLTPLSIPRVGGPSFRVSRAERSRGCYEDAVAGTRLYTEGLYSRWLLLLGIPKIPSEIADGISLQ